MHALSTAHDTYYEARLTAYMLSNAVAVDGTTDEEEVAGIVHGQRPEGIRWQGH